MHNFLCTKNVFYMGGSVALVWQQKFFVRVSFPAKFSCISCEFKSMQAKDTVEKWNVE